MNVWAVVFSNYEPAEVAELYDNEAAAAAHAASEVDPFRVVCWPVRSRYIEPGSEDGGTQ